MNEQLKNDLLIRKIFILIFIFIGFLGFTNSNFLASSTSTDYSSSIDVTGWDILDSAGNNIASENNPAIVGERYRLVFSWKLETTGDVIHSGDIFRLRLPQNHSSGSWSINDSEYVDFYSSEGVVLGKWRVRDGYFETVFGDNAEGANAINASYVTGGQALVNYTYVKGPQLVTFGDMTRQLYFDGVVLTSLTEPDFISTVSTSNNSITWHTHINNVGLLELAKAPQGEEFVVKHDAFFEAELSSIEVTQAKFYALGQIPVDLSSGVPSTKSYTFDISSYFTKVEQNAGESYAKFKSRLNDLEYGMYEDGSGDVTLVANLGDIGDNGITYSDIDPNFAANMAEHAIVKLAAYPESDRAALETYFSNVYGDSNVIGGDVAAYLVRTMETYDKVSMDTGITQSVKISSTETGTITKSAVGVLQGNVGNASVNSTEAGAYLIDEETNVLLEGATFKLQYFDGSSWIDQTSVGTLTTDVDGFVYTGNIGNGKYRFVQLTTSSPEYELTISQGYDSNLDTVVSQEFTVNSSDTEGQIVEITNKTIKFSVTYKPGAQGAFTDLVYSDILRGSETPIFTGDLDGNGNPVGNPGYSFTGWDKTIESTVTADATYTAMWETEKYNINYVLDGGTNDSSNPTTYEYGVGVTSFGPATKVGYNFIGWEDASGNEITAISKTETGDKTLYAKYEAQEYKISYVLDGGTNDSSNPTTYKYGVGVKSFGPATKVGYNFIGWEDASGNEITAISSSETGDKTLYAKYEAQEYKISYVLDGGTNDSSNPTTYEYGVGVTSFGPATKVGYNFIGWEDASGNAFTSISKTDSGDKTLYAKYDAQVYKIDYVLDGGTNDSSNPTTYEYGVGVTSFGPATKVGYNFIGWEDASGNEVTAISKTETGDKTLYAKYDAQVYKIDYVLDGGTNDSSNPTTYEYGVGVTSFGPATKVGYDFIGWEDANGNEITAISKTETGDKTLYAKYDAQVYKIDYVLDGGTNDSSNPTTYEYGVGVTSFGPATKVGYNFIGWEDANGNEITAISKTETGDKTLYAKYEAQVYKIDYVLDGGTNDSSNPTTYEYGVGVTSFGPATKVGYDFIGWEDASGNEITAISKTETGDKTLYAKYEEQIYNINYVLEQEQVAVEPRKIHFPGGHGEDDDEDDSEIISETESEVIEETEEDGLAAVNHPDNPTFYKYGVGVDSFGNPTKAGYNFLGWTDADGNEFTSISKTDTGDKTLYANWDEQVYNIDYVLDGGVNDSSNPDSYKYGVGVDSFANPTKDGYDFLGWTDADGNEFTSISKTDMGDKTLYANWELIEVETPSEDASEPTDKSEPSFSEMKIADTGMNLVGSMIATIAILIALIVIKNNLRIKF